LYIRTIVLSGFHLVDTKLTDPPLYNRENVASVVREVDIAMETYGKKFKYSQICIKR